MDYSPTNSSVHKIFQARILEWVAIPFPDLPNPGIEPRSPALQDSLLSELPGKPKLMYNVIKVYNIISHNFWRLYSTDYKMVDCNSCVAQYILIAYFILMLLLFSCSVVSDSLLTLWTAAGQASLSLTVSRSLPKFMSVTSVMPSSHLTLSPSALNLSLHQGLFQWVSCSHQMTKILELQIQHQSFQGEFRIDFP